MFVVEVVSPVLRTGLLLLVDAHVEVEEEEDRWITKKEAGKSRLREVTIKCARTCPT